MFFFAGKKKNVIIDSNKLLVGGLNPSEKYEFVNWDDEIPNINGNMPKMATKPPTRLRYERSYLTKVDPVIPLSCDCTTTTRDLSPAPPIRHLEKTLGFFFIKAQDNKLVPQRKNHEKSQNTIYIHL